MRAVNVLEAILPRWASLFQHFRLVFCFYVLTFLSIFINWPYRIYNTHCEHGPHYTPAHRCRCRSQRGKENLLHFMAFRRVLFCGYCTVSKRWDYVCAYQQPMQQQPYSILQMFYEYIGDGVGISFPFTTCRLVQRKSIKIRRIRCKSEAEKSNITFVQWNSARPLSLLAIATNKNLLFKVFAVSAAAALSLPKHNRSRAHGNSFVTIKI